MSSFENLLRSIIQSAAKDFDETVDRDPTVTSAEDGTARGDYLDSILAQQKAQRDQLWKQLHEVRAYTLNDALFNVYLIYTCMHLLYSWKTSIANEA